MPSDGGSGASDGSGRGSETESHGSSSSEGGFGRDSTNNEGSRAEQRKEDARRQLEISNKAKAAKAKQDALEARTDVGTGGGIGSGPSVGQPAAPAAPAAPTTPEGSGFHQSKKSNISSQPRQESAGSGAKQRVRGISGATPRGVFHEF